MAQKRQAVLPPAPPVALLEPAPVQALPPPVRPPQGKRVDNDSLPRRSLRALAVPSRAMAAPAGPARTAVVGRSAHPAPSPAVASLPALGWVCGAMVRGRG